MTIATDIGELKIQLDFILLSEPQMAANRQIILIKRLLHELKVLKETQLAWKDKMFS